MDKDEKSGEERKLSTKTEPNQHHGENNSDEVGQIEISQMNTDGSEQEAETDNGKEEIRKLSNTEDGSEKRFLDGDETEHADKTVAEQDQERTIMDLPGELLIKIIDMVPRSQWASMELVSHEFQDIMHGMWGLLREIRMDEFVYNKEKKQPHQIVEAALEKILIRAPNVTLISGIDEFFNESTKIRLETVQLLSKFEHLQTISFSGQFIVSAENLAVFLDSSASRQCWKSLDISGCVLESRISQDGFGGQENQPVLNLESFNCNQYMMGILDRFLPIEWSGLKKLVVDGISLSANAVLSTIRQCTQLAHLEINLPNCENGRPSYTDLMQSVADLENLSVLTMSGLSSWDKSFHDALLVLIQNLARRGITDLALVSCYCSYQTIDAIIDHLKHLKSLELDVTHCTPASLERLANTRRMGQLETLKFQPGCETQMNGTVIRAIVGNLGNLQCLHLVKLNINLEDSKCLGDLRNLKELRIWGRSLESGTRTIDNWTRAGFGSLLETLELSFRIRDALSPEAMGGFLKNMPRLSCLILKEGGAIDNILATIALSCPKLVELDVGWSPFTSAGFQSVIDRCSRLKILKIHGYRVMEMEWFPTAFTMGKYRKITFIKFMYVSGRYTGVVCA